MNPIRGWRCIICEHAVYVQQHTCATATVKEPLNSDPQENDKDLGLRAIEELHSRNEEQTSVISVMNMSFEISGIVNEPTLAYGADAYRNQVNHGERLVWLDET